MCVICSGWGFRPLQRQERLKNSPLRLFITTFSFLVYVK
jgi:hypothetical protein